MHLRVHTKDPAESIVKNYVDPKSELIKKSALFGDKMQPCCQLRGGCALIGVILSVGRPFQVVNQSQKLFLICHAADPKL